VLKGLGAAGDLAVSARTPQQNDSRAHAPRAQIRVHFSGRCSPHAGMWAEATRHLWAQGPCEEANITSHTLSAPHTRYYALLPARRGVV
jgi:hypothetical protein